MERGEEGEVDSEADSHTHTHRATPQKPPVACSHEHLKLLVPLGISFIAFIL